MDDAKNVLTEIITPDKTTWKPIAQVAPAVNPAESGKSAAPAVTSKPAWAE